jgi:putative serine protease PepD
MSDTQGTRPDDSTPEFPAAADGSAPQSEQPLDAPAAPQAAQPVDAPIAPQAEQTVDAPVAPQQGFPPPPQTPAWQAPQGVDPAGPPAGQQPYPPQTPPYGPPRVPTYAGAQAPAGTYTGQPAPGQPYAGAFGTAGARPDLNQTQPTVPLGPTATGSVPTSPAVKKKSGAGKVAGLIVAAALVGGAAGLGGAYAGVNLFAPAGSLPAAGPATVTVNNTDSVNQTTAIAGKVLPSVVTISATSANGAGTGSGVVLTSDGYVVTNTHVVTLDGATADAVIRVTTSDGRVYDAEVVGTDPTYDLAVIKLADAEGLTPVEFADSSELNVGDQTIALGAPLGLSNTVTTGIVSALNRSIQIASAAAPDAGDSGETETPDQGQTPEDGQTPPFFFDFGEGDTQQQTPSETISIAVIQTDAAINPGNSGGALVDADGRLIGVNVAIATAGGMSGEAGSIGVGFAIPSNIVQRVTDEIIENGAATHGLLGASVQDAAAVEDSTITGAYIAEVVADGAALEAGLQEGDIVTAFNGVPITDATDLTAQVRAVAAGSDATVTYVRDGETRTVDVTLGELPL